MKLLRAVLGEVAFRPLAEKRRRECDVGGLVRLLRREASRPHAARALADLRAAEAIPALVALLGRTDLAERREVAAALGVLGHGDESASAALADALGDPDPWVQASAAAALLALGDPLGMNPPLAAHEREVFERVLGVAHPLVDAGLASVEVTRPPTDPLLLPEPPQIAVRPSSPRACPITVQIDHARQVSLFMGEPTWCESWHDERDDYLDWVEGAVRAVVEGRYEEWVKPGTQKARGVFHLPDGPHAFYDNVLRDDTAGFEHRTYSAYNQ